jgi:HEAT repeat protein
MSRRETIVVVILLLGVLVVSSLVVGLNWISTEDPTYEAKPLSVWVEELSYSRSPEVRSQAVVAVRSLGTNAIPLLLSYLSRTDNDDKLMRYLKQQWVKRFGGAGPDEPVFFRARAVAGFEALGTIGKPAIPVLKHLIESNDTAVDAARALGAIRTPDVLSNLVEYLESLDSITRTAGVAGLGLMREEARRSLPKLAKMVVNDPSDSVRTYAAESLGAIGPADAVVPILLERLENDPSPKVRSCSGFVLTSLPVQPGEVAWLERTSELHKSEDVRALATWILSKLQAKELNLPRQP